LSHDLLLLYFIILPVFVCTLVCMSSATLASRFIEPLRPAYPFAWRVLVGSVLGFLLANALMLALFLIPPGAEQASDAAKFAYAAALFLGPAIVSLIGFLGGSILGVWFAIKSRSSKSRSQEGGNP